MTTAPADPPVPPRAPDAAGGGPPPAPPVLPPLVAVFVAPGALVPRLRFDDPESRMNAAGHAVGCLAAMAIGTFFVGGPDGALMREVAVAIMCLGGVFIWPVLRMLAGRAVALRRFAHVYAYVLPLAAAQAATFLLGIVLPPLFVGSALVGVWAAVVLAVLLHRTLAVAGWKSAVAIVVAGTVQIALLIGLVLLNMPAHL